MSGSPLPVGIIGTGRHGSRYAEHILRHVRGLRLAAISRRSSAGRAQAAAWGCRFYPDWRDLVADPGVAAVIAATTPNLHLEIARACAGAGKPLLVEKPLATEVAAGRAMLRACRAAGVPLTVGHTLRCNSVVRALKREVGRIGRLHLVAASQRMEETQHAWLDDPAIAGGGVALHTAVHIFDTLYFVTGRRIVRVRGESRCRHTRRLEDLLVATVELEGDVLGLIDAAKVGDGRCGRYELVGEKAQLHADQVHHRLELISGRGPVSLPCGPPVFAIVPLLRQWAAFLAGRGDNPVPAEDGLAAVAVADACRRSAVSGKWQEVEAV